MLKANMSDLLAGSSLSGIKPSLSERHFSSIVLTAKYVCIFIYKHAHTYLYVFEHVCEYAHT